MANCSVQKPQVAAYAQFYNGGLHQDGERRKQESARLTDELANTDAGEQK
jgi:hypothetical protein